MLYLILIFLIFRYKIVSVTSKIAKRDTKSLVFCISFFIKAENRYKIVSICCKIRLMDTKHFLVCSQEERIFY